VPNDLPSDGTATRGAALSGRRQIPETQRQRHLPRAQARPD